MSADIRTRRVIVTLPDVSGEESEGAIEEILGYLGDTAVVGAKVEHALDDVPLDLVAIEGEVQGGMPHVRVQMWRTVFHPAEIRKLAALLLRAADESEGLS